MKQAVCREALAHRVGEARQLDALGAQGALQFDGAGGVALRPQAGIDYRAGTIAWRYYRYVTATRFEYVRSGEERF